MPIDKSISWDISNICNGYAQYCRNNGKISFSDYYFMNTKNKTIKKIYYKERFEKFLSFEELSFIAKKYAAYVNHTSKIVYFSSWYEENISLIDRYMKMKKLEKIKEEQL